MCLLCGSFLLNYEDTNTTNELITGDVTNIKGTLRFGAAPRTIRYTVLLSDGTETSVPYKSEYPITYRGKVILEKLIGKRTGNTTYQIHNTKGAENYEKNN